MDGSGNVTAVNTFGAAGLVSRHVATGSTFYTFDTQGNAVERLDSGQNVLSTDVWDAFGKLLSGPASDAWGYEAQDGYFTDTETGLIALSYRYYDPAQGRFLNRDPIGFGGAVNLYGYTRSRGVGRTDPAGLEDESVIPESADTGPSNLNSAQQQAERTQSEGEYAAAMDQMRQDDSGGTMGGLSPSGGGSSGGGSESEGGGGGGGAPGSLSLSPVGGGSGQPAAPLPPLPSRNVGGQDIPLPDPRAGGSPHTTIGERTGEDGVVYRQSATFPGPTWPPADGEQVPWSRVDWHDHGRAESHPNPHQHLFNYNWVQRRWEAGGPSPCDF